MLSRRNALLAAIAAALVLVAFFFWPEKARADFAFSARAGGSIGHSSGVGARLHLGDRAALHGGTFGRGAFHHGRKHRGVHGDRSRFDRHHKSFKGRHFRDRVRFGDGFDRGNRLAGRGFRSRLLLGDLFLGSDKAFLGSDFRHRKHGHGWRWRGRSLRAEGLVLAPLAVTAYGDADVVVREIIVPVPVPAARPDAVAEPRPLNPRGRVLLAGEEEGIVGDWAPGDRLPDELPHVTLDPVAYGLPDPPYGEKYARVGNDVLRIEMGSRRIVEVVAR